jgi:hypothetical protein
LSLPSSAPSSPACCTGCSCQARTAAAIKWIADYRIEGIDGLELHHLYRAMAWLGEEIGPAASGALAPRCVKDVIEERLFERRRDLFSDLSLVFMDTTSLSFYGAGGDSLGAYGHSKDHRADLKQMILAVVIDGQGRPICTEMLPGNTADATVLLPVVDRLRERFHIGRVCVVADRGMISAATIAARRRSWPICARATASSSNGPTCCAISTACRRPPSRKTASASPPALPSPAKSAASFRPPASPCRPICANGPPDPSASPGVVLTPNIGFVTYCDNASFLKALLKSG